MLVRLEKKAEIAEAQREFDAICRSQLSKTAIHNITFRPSKLLDCEVQTDGKYWVRNFLYEEGVSGPRYINSFGLYDAKSEDLSITVEINAYVNGLGRRVSGFYAKNIETGRVYLMHTGGIRGGTTGQGKYAFLTWRNQKLTKVIDSEGTVEFAVIVMAISGAHALEPALRYVDDVAEFKRRLRSGELETKGFSNKVSKLRAYYEEGSGRRKGTRQSDLDYVSRHGLIVSALKTWLEKKNKLKSKQFVKNQYIDLAVVVKKSISKLYEVKTSSSRQDIYTAIGQLSVHSGTSGCERFMVLPDENKLPSDILKALKRINISVIRYTVSGKKIHFKQE